mgnify:CR=1 FL=1
MKAPTFAKILLFILCISFSARILAMDLNTAKTNTTKLYCTAGALLLAALAAFSLFIGKYPLKLELLLAGDEMQWRVFLTLRCSRTLVGVAGGFVLGVAGFVYQTGFRNPLASPDIIGVSSGASAGAAAGMAAHLAGAIAANTTLPVIGIPVKSSNLDGIDALLSTVQMPSGIPVATVAINGAVNAALLSIQMLSIEDAELAEKLQAKRDADARKVLEKNAAVEAEFNK